MFGGEMFGSQCLCIVSDACRMEKRATRKKTLRFYQTRSQFSVRLPLPEWLNTWQKGRGIVNHGGFGSSNREPRRGKHPRGITVGGRSFETRVENHADESSIHLDIPVWLQCYLVSSPLRASMSGPHGTKEQIPYETPQIRLALAFTHVPNLVRNNNSNTTQIIPCMQLVFRESHGIGDVRSCVLANRWRFHSMLWSSATVIYRPLRMRLIYRNIVTQSIP
jgi:hypothetical protein